MTRTTDCPDNPTLRRLVEGQASPHDQDSFAGHLERCPRCAENLDRLLTGDTLVEAMRAQTTATDSPSASLAGLIQRARQLASADDPATQSLSDGASATDAGHERFDFLTPPQGTDEIGRLGQYRVLKVLGSGGMGVVFRAEDVRLKRQVALKVMKPDAANKPGARERFLREARAAAALEHENVVTTFQVGEERGVPFLAMQWLKGMSLEERLKSAGPLSVAEVLRLGHQAACGLAAAHERGLIHRDVKPGNLWLEPDQGGRVKILDFGLARSLQDDVQLTQSGTILGTPAYMAPEQARSEKVDPRSDLFSLGVVLYRMVTGQLPFKGDGTMAVLTALATDTPKPVHDLAPTLPPALGELIMQLLSKSPKGRPASAREVADRLQAIDPSPVPTVPRRRRWWGVAVAAGLLLALLPLGWLFGAQVIRIVTDKGLIVIEVDDPKMEVIVQENGAVIKEGPGGREVTLAAGGHELDVTVKDAAGTVHFFTKKFTLSRGGKEVVNVRHEMAQAKPVPPANAERQTAEWALSVGGEVGLRVGDRIQPVLAVTDLPAGPIQVAKVMLANKDRVTDDDLERLGALPHLRHLDLYGTPVGDAGMVHLKDFTNLESLTLWDTHVGDAGMAHLAGLTKLITLNVHGTRVGDAGTAHLRNFIHLKYLRLSSEPVGDAGMANLRVLTKLTKLILNDTRVGDAGMEHLKALTNLTWLSLRGSRVGDLGMVPLKDLPLVGLDLQGTRVGDAGLQHLQGLNNLRELFLNKTPTTAEGVKKLADALPHCKIVSDHGTFEPKLVPANDRKAAEWVLSVGGTLLALTADKEQTVRDAKDLPKGPFWVAAVHLENQPRVTDQGLENLQGLSRLSILTLSRTTVTDAGLRPIESLPQLRQLELTGTRVTEAGVVRLKGLAQLESLGIAELPISDAGLEQLKGMQKLTSLGLGSTRVTDAGLVHLKALPNLNTLFLMQTGITDAGLEQFKTMPNLTHLYLDHMRVSDVGLEHLTALPNLQLLGMRFTQVTDAGLVHLKRCRHLGSVSLGGTRVGDAGVEHLKALTGLQSLDLTHTAVSDAGLEHLKGLSNLQLLYLGDTRVTDAGLVHLRGMTKLGNLALFQTRITDAGLEDLARLPKLTNLDLNDTYVSAQGFATVKTIFPNADLVWSERNRSVAEAVLALGGVVHIRLKGKPNDLRVKTVAELPAESLQLTHVGMVGVKKPFTDLLSQLAKLIDPAFDRLEVLDLTAATASDADLESLRPLTSLKELTLAKTAVTDAGLVHLMGLKNLNKLVLDGAAIRGQGIADLKDLPGLTDLSVGCATLTDLFVKPVGDLKKLERLSLAGSQVSDASLKELHGLTSLKELDLTGTKVSAAGVAELQKVLPKCKVASNVAEK